MTQAGLTHRALLHRIEVLEAALQRIAEINNGPDKASGEWRCTEAASIAHEALHPERKQP